MAGYTVVNLKQVEDSAPRFGLAPSLEARFARDALALERSGLGYQRLAPNFRTPFGHSHREQEEVYVVVGGSGRAKLGDEVVELGSWDADCARRRTDDAGVRSRAGRPRAPGLRGTARRPGDRRRRVAPRLVGRLTRQRVDSAATTAACASRGTTTTPSASP